MQEKLSAIAYVDVETTGMRPEHDRIIEIGIVRTENGVIVKKYSTLLDPGRTVSAFITSINGITNEALVSAPPFEEVALEIAELLDGAVFVAHNVRFDYAFIKQEFKRVGMAFKHPYACSVVLSRTLFPRYKKHNLDAIIERFGFTCESRHRAFDDAYVIYEFFEAIKKKHGEERLLETLAEQMGDGNLRVRKDALRDLPDTPGVYRFYNQAHEPIYIGKSVNIRTRVRSHFAESAEEHRLSEETVSVEVTETAGELSALLLESRSIKEDLPIYNRALRKKKKIIVAYERFTQNGYKTAELQSESEVDTDQKIVALFRSMSHAKETIREIAQDSRLCQKLLQIESGEGPCFGSQIERCEGACVGRESPKSYNERFDDAFSRRKIKSWPYSGAIMVKEQKTEDSGIAFLVKDWRVLESYSYENGCTETFLSAESEFDYDTYKILARFILNPKNRACISSVSERELKAMRLRDSEEYEPVIT